MIYNAKQMLDENKNGPIEGGHGYIWLFFPGYTLRHLYNF